MGLFSHHSSSTEAAPLEPFQPPLGVHPAYCMAQQTYLSIKPDTWAKNYDITDSQGVVVVKCEGKALSCKTITNAQTGQILFKLDGKWSTTSEFGFDVAGNELFKLKPSDNGPMSLHFLNTASSTSLPIDLVLTEAAPASASGVAKWSAGLAGAAVTMSIHLGTRPVTFVTREKMRTLDTKNKPYQMTVAAGVDLALMAAVMVTYDKIVMTRTASVSADVAGAVAG